MSGLYNMLFKVDPMAGFVLSVLRVDHRSIARFRDAWLDWADEAMTDPVMVILTRTGQDKEANAPLRLLPGYRSDCADSFDRTYAEFVFDSPEEFGHAVRSFLAATGRRPTLRERFETATRDLTA